MRKLFTLLLTLSALFAQAQTYYYINGITVDPNAPTTADDITITVQGDLSNTAATINSAFASVTGSQVTITIVAMQDGIGLDVLVPHAIPLNIGPLPAGTYQIGFTGAGYLDSAPAPQHAFTVTGATATDCDSLDIISFQWAAFNSNQLIITAANGSSDLFDYPGFVLISENGDTLAREITNFFGIGTGPQTHVLNVLSSTLGQDPVQGTLQLWSGFYTELECEWEIDQTFCPSSPCAPVSAYISNFGGGLVSEDFPFTVSDAINTVVASGTLSLQGSQQSDEVELCLAPGTYTLSMAPVAPPGGQLVFGLTVGAYPPQQAQQDFVQNGQANVLPFTFYPACIEDDNAMAELGQSDWIVRVTDDRLIINEPSGEMIGRVLLFDASGRCVRSEDFRSAQASLSLHQLATGHYVVRNLSGSAAAFVR